MTEELLVTKLTMIASQIQHEDDLMGQRTNWLVVSLSRRGRKSGDFRYLLPK